LRWTGGDINRERPPAQELVGLQPDIILTNGRPPTVAVQRETRTIPIVFVNVADPVASGIVPRLNLTESTTVNQLLLRIKELARLNQTEGGYGSRHHGSGRSRSLYKIHGKADERARACRSGGSAA